MISILTLIHPFKSLKSIFFPARTFETGKVGGTLKKEEKIFVFYKRIETNDKNQLQYFKILIF